MDWDLEPSLVELQGEHVIPPWYHLLVVTDVYFLHDVIVVLCSPSSTRQ